MVIEVIEVVTKGPKGDKGDPGSGGGGGGGGTVSVGQTGRDYSYDDPSYSTVADAWEAALLDSRIASGGTIVADESLHAFDRPVTISTNNIQVRGQGPVTRIQGANTNPTAGVFDVNADRFSMMDVELQIGPIFRTNQPAILSRGNRTSLHRVTCRSLVTSGFITTDPMHFLVVDGSLHTDGVVVSPLVENCHFIPSQAVVAVEYQNVIDYGFHHNVLRGETQSGSTVSCQEWLALNTAMKGTIIGNRAHNVENVVEGLIVHRSTPAAVEDGHVVAVGNYFEVVRGVTDDYSIFKVMGARFWNLTGNEFGKIDGLSAEGSACIHLTSNDGTAGTVGASGNIVSSNQFHNIGQAGGNACAIFASHNDGLRIVGCQGNILQSPLVELSDSCRDTSIDSTTALMAQDTEALKVSFATTGLRVRGMDVGKDDGSDVAAANVFFRPPDSSPGNVINAVNVDFSDCVFRSSSVGVRFQFGSTNQPVRFSNCRNDGSGALQVNADVGTGTGSSVSGLFDGLTGDDPDNAALIENLTTNAS